MELDLILKSYDSFFEKSLSSKFVKHSELIQILDRHSPDFEMEVVGSSFEGRELRMIKSGNGPCKIFLWSQMHGDEATGTMALLDLLNFLKQQPDSSVAKGMLDSCTLYLLPMVNPDGAQRLTRRNAQQIDINRDFLLRASPEARILRKVHDKICPAFGFNLHDQSNLWGVKGMSNPAVLSFLAPAFDEACSLNANRTKAMQVIASIKDDLTEVLPGNIGLFDDTFEPRAFGDNFQAARTATILIEGGSIISDDSNQQVRKMFFGAMLAGLHAIATGSFLQKTVQNYTAIPENTKSLFHILIRNIALFGIRTSIGINYKNMPAPDGSTIQRCYTVEDLGDLSLMQAHEVYDADNMQIHGDIYVDGFANFDLLDGAETILSFKQGILQSK